MKNILLFLLLLISANLLFAQTYIATHFDNDMLYIPKNQDREYTFGLGLIAGWERSKLPQKSNLWRYQSLQAGIELYTPDNLSAAGPIPADRPYASLIYLQSQWTRARANKGRMLQQDLTVGMMGLYLAGQVQDAAHAFTRNLRQMDEPAAPQGWANQISEGGEPTLSYRALLQQRVGMQVLPRWFQLQVQCGGELGYQTEAYSGLSFRLGKNRSAFWQIASQPMMQLPLQDRSEWYFYGQTGLRLIGYNAFLQGQWRESVHQLPYHALRPWAMESEMGFVYRRQGFQTGYGLHVRTKEYRKGSQPLFYWATIYVGFAIGA